MKVFCVLIAFVVSAAMAQDILPPGLTIENIWKQTCVDLNKAKMIAAKGGEGCEFLATVDPSFEPKDEEGFAEKYKGLMTGYECLIKANNIRSEDGNADIEKVKSVINSVATSQEKADAINKKIDECVGDAKTVSKDERVKKIMCVVAKLFESKVCHPAE